MYGKSNMKTYITIYKIDSSGNLLYGSGNSTKGSISTERGGWGGRREGGSEGIYVYLWLIHVEV